MPERVLDASTLAAYLGGVLASVAAGTERVRVPIQGTSGVSMLATRSLEALEESFEILSEATLLERLRTGEHALRTGDFTSEKELAEELGVTLAPDAAAMVALPAPGAASQSASAGRWRLVAGRLAKDSLLGLSGREREEVWRYITSTVLIAPEDAGIELVGDLAPRLVARVAGQRIIYRTDTTQHAVRLIDVHPWAYLHLAR
jgi:hypothetical protein